MNDLFADDTDYPINVLGEQGEALSCEALYFGPCLGSDLADDYFERLLQGVDWQHDEVVIHGKTIHARRMISWHADAAYSYGYSNTKRTALPWTPDLLALKDWVEQRSGESYNACLLNLYTEGSVGLAWHSDAERELKPEGAIASISLGAERRFLFRHKQNRETREVLLQHGSLLVMKGATQKHWLHSLPPTAKVSAPRINLTFRTILTDQTGRNSVADPSVTGRAVS